MPLQNNGASGGLAPAERTIFATNGEREHLDFQRLVQNLGSTGTRPVSF
jgi:hypothetical protein